MAINKVTTDVIDMSGNTGGLVWAKGATGDQPLPVNSTAGDLRENTTTGKTEVFNGTEWRNLKEAATPLIVDFLVVAGGGGGGFDDAGGGGAGGLRTSFGPATGGGVTPAESSKTLSLNISYAIDVGVGGTGSQTPTKGGNSIFDDIVSDGGGAGMQVSGALQDGGSGSGGTGNSVDQSPGTATIGQGFDGGDGYPRLSNDEAGGGGGGAAGPGTAASSNTGGAGGAGLEVQITGTTGLTATYAGDGGGGGRTTGGAGGIGGGAAGTGAGNPINAPANKGGGGGTSGANSGSYSGSNGGSGIVILRYPSNYSVTVGSGLITGVLNGTVSGGTDKYTTFTAGTGTITFS